MKRLLVLLTLILTACNLFIAPEETLDPKTGDVKYILYPEIKLNGPAVIMFVAGEDTYVEAGAIATLGTEDVSDQIVISGSVDANTPGLYSLEYLISVTNELGTQSTDVVFRYVAVLYEDVANVDLSGDYISEGDFFGPESLGKKMSVKKIEYAYYSSSDVMAYPEASQSGNFFYLGQGKGELEPIQYSKSIFGLKTEAEIDVTPEGNLVIHLFFPEIEFGYDALWNKE